MSTIAEGVYVDANTFGVWVVLHNTVLYCHMHGRWIEGLDAYPCALRVLSGSELRDAFFKLAKLENATKTHTA